MQDFYNTQRLQMKKFTWVIRKKIVETTSWKSNQKQQKTAMWENGKNVHDDDEGVANWKIDAVRWILMEIINAIKGDYNYISESFHKYL